MPNTWKMFILGCTAWFPVVRLLEVIMDWLKMLKHLSVRFVGR